MENIILNEVYCVEYFKDKNNKMARFSEKELVYIRRTNIKLEKLYAKLPNYLKGC